MLKRDIVEHPCLDHLTLIKSQVIFPTVTEGETCVRAFINLASGQICSC